MTDIRETQEVPCGWNIAIGDMAAFELCTESSVCWIGDDPHQQIWKLLKDAVGGDLSGYIIKYGPEDIGFIWRGKTLIGAPVFVEARHLEPLQAKFILMPPPRPSLGE